LATGLITRYSIVRFIGNNFWHLLKEVLIYAIENLTVASSRQPAAIRAN
jgi:hypothetical protein